MVKRYAFDAFVDMFGLAIPDVTPLPSGPWVRYADALPYMVWQPIPEDLSELPKAHLQFLDAHGDPHHLHNTIGERELAYMIKEHRLTHWALAPVFKEEENAYNCAKNEVEAEATAKARLAPVFRAIVQEVEA